MKTADETSVASGQLTITRSFGFSASHTSCGNCRWCTNAAAITDTTTSVTASALVYDGAPGDLSSLGDYLDKMFDHRLLNDQVDSIRPANSSPATSLSF